MIAFLLLFRNMWRILKILSKQEEQQAVMAALVFILLLGTVFYHNIEGMGYLDALYFSVMTLATVGYGDLYPQTALGKIFSIVYVLLGVGIISASIANFNQALAQHHRDKKRGKQNEDK